MANDCDKSNPSSTNLNIICIKPASARDTILFTDEVVERMEEGVNACNREMLAMVNES